MKSISALIFCALCLLASAEVATPQQLVGDEQGLLPNGSYHGGNVDSVNLENGNLTIRIPLFSLPQKGRLSLSYSLVLNNQAFSETQFCDDPSTPGAECYSQYIQTAPIGPQLVMDQAINLQQQITELPATQECSPPDCSTTAVPAEQDTIIDASGASHALLYDVSDWPRLYSVDGTGYMYQTAFTQQNFQPWIGNPTDPNSLCPNNFKAYMLGTIYTADGISHSYQETCPTGSVDDLTYDIGEIQSAPISMRDPSGNAISYSLWTGTTGFTFPGMVTDSMNRTIPDFYRLAWDSTVSSRCPDLGVSNQTAQFSKTWAVPGANGSSATYTFCMTEVGYNTLFGGGEPGESETVSGQLYDPQAIGGSTAIQSVVLPNGTYWGFIYDSAGTIVDKQVDGGGSYPDPVATAIAYGTLTKIILPTGGAVSYDYQQYTACDQMGAVKDFVKARTIDALDGNPAKWQYAYEETTGIVLNSDGTSTVVPSKTTVTDPNLNDTVHTFTNPPNANYSCQYRVETQMQQFNGSKANNSVLKTTTTKYDNAGVKLLLGTYYSYSQGPTSSAEAATSGISDSKSYAYPALVTVNLPYCDYLLGSGQDESNCALSVEADMQIAVAFSSPSSIMETLSDNSFSNETDTMYQYQSVPEYLSANLLALPSSVSTKDELTNTIVSKTTYGYDESNGSPQGVYGNLTSVDRWVNTGGPDVVTGTVYDVSGKAKTEIDANHNQTSIDYQCALPYTVKNAAGETTTYTYDCNTGKVGQVQTPNDAAASRPGTVYTYNDYGDLESVSYPDGGGVTIDYHSYTIPLHITTTTKADPDPTVVSDTYYDGLARVINKAVSGGATVATTYDGLGNVSSVSNSYYAASGPDGATSYAYDPLGRMRYQCQPDNGTATGQCAPGTSYVEWSYSGDTIDYYDEDRHHWQRTVDPLGRLTKVLEPNASNTPALETDYKYDPLNNLTNVDQWGGAKGSSGERARVFQYDSLSRLTSSTNPETGWTTYTYLRSNVPCSGSPSLPCSKKDARGMETSYWYDMLNRVTSKTYSDSSTTIACFQYSQANVTNGIGQLANEWTQEGSTTCSGTLPSSKGYFAARSFTAYDPMGRLWSESDCTTSGCRSSAPCQTAAGMESYSYDLAGNLVCSGNGIALTPGAGTQPVQFSQSYDSVGRLVNLRTTWQGFPSTLANIQSYSASGGITAATFAAGAIGVTRGFDARQRLLNEKDTGTGPASATNGSGSISITGTEQTK